MWLTGDNRAVSGNCFIHSFYHAIRCKENEQKGWEQCEPDKSILSVYQGIPWTPPGLGWWFSRKTGNMLWLLLKIQPWIDIDSLSEHRDKVRPHGAFLTEGNPITLLSGLWKFENNGRQNCRSDRYCDGFINGEAKLVIYGIWKNSISIWLSSKLTIKTYTTAHFDSWFLLFSRCWNFCNSSSENSTGYRANALVLIHYHFHSNRRLVWWMLHVLVCLITFKSDKLV